MVMDDRFDKLASFDSRNRNRLKRNQDLLYLLACLVFLIRLLGLVLVSEVRRFVPGFRVKCPFPAFFLGSSIVLLRSTRRFLVQFFFLGGTDALS
jgi:hypothetical protein